MQQVLSFFLEFYFTEVGSFKMLAYFPEINSGPHVLVNNIPVATHRQRPTSNTPDSNFGGRCRILSI